MKKRIFFIIILIGFLFLLPIPEYVELNDLIIVESIEIICKEKQYEINLKEIIPKKEDNSIEYHYQEYSSKGTSIREAKKNLEKNHTKKFYYQSSKKIITNCSNIEKISNLFSIKKRKIKNS